MSALATTRIVGTPVPRKEGVEKLLGRACYVDDMERKGMWFGATVRSAIPRGLIRSIAFDRRIDWSEFAVVTAADIPGENCIQLIVADQPCLADGKVNHCEEPIVLLAHTDKHKLREAAGAVQIEYDPLPPVFTIEESERQDPIVWGSDNIIKSFLIEKGDVDSAWAGAAHIVEGEYRTGAQEHLYIENNGIIAEYSAEGGVTVWGSLQCPYYVFKSLRAVFDLPEDKVRVIQTETGGAFGGKEDYPSILACHAALLAMKSGHPVKMVYDRMEDLAATTKRHPSRVRHRTALDSDGKLLAMESTSRPTAAPTPRFQRRCFRAPRCTPQDRTFARMCACGRAPGPRIRFLTAHFAASARRKPFSPWSGTWMRLPRRSASIPWSCGGEISCTRATPTQRNS